MSQVRLNKFRRAFTTRPSAFGTTQPNAALPGASTGLWHVGGLRRKHRLLILLVAVVFTLSGLAVTAPQASATPYYNSTSVGLCRGSASDTQMNLPRTMSISRVRGTSDYTMDANGYSLRTCFWKGVAGSFSYACPSSSNASGWTLDLVSRAENHPEAQRQRFAIICDGAVRTIAYSGLNPSWATHIHLHDPTECGPRRFLRDPDCPVLGRFKLVIDRPQL
jgi:hypothetical protein